MKKHNVGDKQYVPHIVQEGARYHVISYHGGNRGAYVRCSEPNCTENKRYDRLMSEPIPMEEPTYIVSPPIYDILKPWIDEQKRLKSYKINI